MRKVMLSLAALGVLLLPGCALLNHPQVDQAKGNVVQAQLDLVKADLAQAKVALANVPAGTPPSVAAFLQEKVAQGEAKALELQKEIESGKKIPWGTVGISVLLAIVGAATKIHHPIGMGIDLVTTLAANLPGKIGDVLRRSGYQKPPTP